MRRYGIHCRCKLKSRRDDTFGQSWMSRHGWRNDAPAPAVSLSPCRPEGFVLGGDWDDFYPRAQRHLEAEVSRGRGSLGGWGLCFTKRLVDSLLYLSARTSSQSA